MFLSKVIAPLINRSGVQVQANPVVDALAAPAGGFQAIPTSGAVSPLAVPCRGIVITSAGILDVVMSDGSTNHTQTFSVQAGAVYPFCVIQLGSANTAGVLGLI